MWEDAGAGAGQGRLRALLERLLTIPALMALAR